MTQIKILITGSSGMLGSAIARAGDSLADVQIVRWNRNLVELSNVVDVSREMAIAKPDVVIHSAALVGGIQANIAQPTAFLNKNIQLDNNVINASLEAGVTKFVYVGSSCMYPKDFRQPLKESDILGGPLEPTNEGYALAKIVGSKTCEYISKEHGLSYKTIIPSNLYGPGDNFSSASSHLVAACIAKIFQAKASGTTFVDVWGDGTARREFTYTEDVANWLISNIDTIPAWPSYLNLGYGADFSINDFYEHAMIALDYRVDLRHDLSKPAGMKQKLMDSSEARSNFNWNPLTTLERGMSATAAAYSEKANKND